MKRVLVSDPNGVLGKVVCKRFTKNNVELIELNTDELDSNNSADSLNFFPECKPQLVAYYAPLAGGIYASMINSSRFFLENAYIDNLVLNTSRSMGDLEFICIDSSFKYPIVTEFIFGVYFVNRITRSSNFLTKFPHVLNLRIEMSYSIYNHYKIMTLLTWHENNRSAA